MTRLACLRWTLALALLAGCSADVDDVFGTGEGTSGSGGSSSGSLSTGQTSSANGTGSTSSSATSGSTTSGPTSSVTSSTTSGDPTTTSATSSTTSGDPVTTAASTGSGNPGPTVDCDGQACPVDGDGVCCWTDSTDTGLCTDEGLCQSSIGSVSTRITCQTPDDCPGQICCAHRAWQSGSAPYASASCSSDCDYPDLYLCDPNAPMCPSYQDGNGNTIQSTCKASTLLPPGYWVCGFN